MSASLNLLTPSTMSAGKAPRIGYSNERTTDGRDMFQSSSAQDFDRALQQQIQRRETTQNTPARSSEQGPKTPEPPRPAHAAEPRREAENSARPEQAAQADAGARTGDAATPRADGTPGKDEVATPTEAEATIAETSQTALTAEQTSIVADPNAHPSLPEHIAALLAQSMQGEPSQANLAALPAALAALNGHRNALPTPLHSDAASADAALIDEGASRTPALPNTLPATSSAASSAALLTDAAADGASSPAHASTGKTTTDDSPAKSLQNRALLFGEARTATSDTVRNASSDGSTKMPELTLAALSKAGADGMPTDLQNLPGSHAASNPAGLQPGHAAFHALMRSATHSPTNVPQLPVHTPAGQPAWAQDVGNQVHWMLGRAENKAELVLTPPNMGKLEVSISLNGDQTTAQFIAATQAARDALEQAMPRLREILQQAGITLGDTQVSTSGEQAARDGQQDGRSNRGSAPPNGVNEVATVSTPVAALGRHDGMVDTFV